MEDEPAVPSWKAEEKRSGPEKNTGIDVSDVEESDSESEKESPGKDQKRTEQGEDKAMPKITEMTPEKKEDLKEKARGSGSDSRKGKEKGSPEILPNKDKKLRLQELREEEAALEKSIRKEEQKLKSEVHQSGSEEEDSGSDLEDEETIRKKIKEMNPKELDRLKRISNVVQEIEETKRRKKKPKKGRVQEIIVTKRPKLDTFSGLPEEDVKSWISSFKARAKLAEWGPEESKKNLLLYLKGKALIWFNREKIADRSVKTILIKMEDTFAPKNRSKAYAEVNNIKQESKETVESYTQRFTQAAKGVYGKQEKQSKALNYIKGLKKDIYIKVSQAEPQDFKKAVRLAKSYEKRLSSKEDYEEEKKIEKRPSRRQSGKSDYVNQRDEANIEDMIQTALKERLDNMGTEVSKDLRRKIKEMNSKQYQKRKEESGESEEKKKRTEKKETRKCFNCQKKGHLARNCPDIRKKRKKKKAKWTKSLLSQKTKKQLSRKRLRDDCRIR